MRLAVPAFTWYAVASVAALALPACNGCSDQKIEPVDSALPVEVPRDIGRWLSMAVTPDGKPAVAYYDVEADALGYAVGTIGADGNVSWAKEQVDSFPDDAGLNPGDAGKYASLVVTADGTPWIAYQDTTNGTLKVARKGDGAWTTAVADIGGGARSDAGYWASIAVDSSGKPVVAHYDQGQGAVRVARWDGTAFRGSVAYDGEQVTGTDGAVIPGNAGAYARLRVAADGTEYIAFYDTALGALRLARGGASGWNVEIVDDAGDVGQWPDLQFAGSVVRIAYQDVGNQDLKIATGAPGSWNTEIVDGGEYVGSDIAIFEEASQPAMVYFDGVNNDMKLARKSGNAWVTDTVTGSEGALGYHNETVSIGGTRYAACYDFTKKTIWFSALPS